MKYNKSQLTSIALVKLIMALTTLGLAAFLEYLHERLGWSSSKLIAAISTFQMEDKITSK